MMGGVPQLRAADVFVKPNPTRPQANVEPSTGHNPGRSLSTPPTKGDGALRGGGRCRMSRGVGGDPESARWGGMVSAGFGELCGAKVGLL